MNESPRPKSEMNLREIGDLGFIGHRIELWESLKNVTVPLPDRIAALREATVKERAALKRTPAAEQVQV